jgi:hypothetical protein
MVPFSLARAAEDVLGCLGRCQNSVEYVISHMSDTAGGLGSSVFHF